MVTTRQAQYELLDGEPLPVVHHGERFTLGTEPVMRTIPHIKAGPRPAQPPGREPYKRS